MRNTAAPPGMLGRRRRSAILSAVSALLAFLLVVFHEHRDIHAVSAAFVGFCRQQNVRNYREQAGRVTANALSPGKYKALTRIRLRQMPDVSSDPTGYILEANEEFEVDEVVEALAPGQQGFLRISGKGGWIFDTGVAGQWVGKPIVEPIAVGVTQVEPESSLPPTAATVPSVAPSPAAVPAPEPAAEEALDSAVVLATVPVQTLQLPEGMLGAGYDLVQLRVKDKVTLTFVLGTGFPTNALTPRGRDLLGDLIPRQQFTGGWMSQAMDQMGKIDLSSVKVAETNALLPDITDFEIFDFAQAQLAAQLGVEIHGILGVPFFSGYDADIFRYVGRMELYQSGMAASQGFDTTVKFMPGLELPSGMLGITVKSSVSILDSEGIPEDEASEVAFIGLLDTAAAHTLINWEAAKMLGYKGPDDPRLQQVTKVLGAGVDGKPVEMPVVRLRLSLCGVPDLVQPKMLTVTKEQFESSGGDGWYFDSASLLKQSENSGVVHFGAVNVAIGDTLSMAVLNDSKIGPFNGAAAVIGQDLLFQTQRVIMNVRDKQLWIEPGDIRDAPEM